MEALLSIFKGYNLSESDLDLIISIAKPLNIKTHKTLINYGERCQKIYFVLKGGFIMKILLDEGAGERTISFNLDCFHPFMTAPHSYFQNVPSNCKLQAIKNSDVLEFEKKQLLDLLEKSDAIRDFYYQQIVEALLTELDFRMKLITLSPQNLYKLFISDYQEVIKNVSSKDIASFIGISPEWLSNLKRKN